MLAQHSRRASDRRAVNKIDLLKHKRRADPVPRPPERGRARFAAIVPVSAKTGRNLPALLRALRDALPEAPPLYPPDELTDRDERFLAAELLREKIFRELGESCRTAARW